MKKVIIGIGLILWMSGIFARGIIDSDVLANIKVLPSETNDSTFPTQFISVFIFLNSIQDKEEVFNFLQEIDGVRAKQLQFMPVVAAIIPKNKLVLNKIAEHAAVAQISSNQAGAEELENSEQAMLLVPSVNYPDIDNWWSHGYVGSSGVLGLIDSGVATRHLSLQNKKLIVDKGKDSGFFEYPEGIRSPHGTGVACIYAGMGTHIFPHDLGIAYGLKTIISGLAGEGIGEAKDLWQTMSTLDWMLSRAGAKPTIFNYSFGNGLVSCANCTDWSGLAKAVDYVVNNEKIMWIKSAGNMGYNTPKREAPFASTMTVPADNYNGITVANMSPTMFQNGVFIITPERNKHTISARSSRGPTLIGRKKPDITAPGDNTWTCAPDPDDYPFKYSDAMHYQGGYRLMGGTSSAAPHVGAAILLMQDAGINNPMLEKALLLNSADAWTDSNQPGPYDLGNSPQNAHFPVMGSEWNRTFGWGYINLQKAFDERHNLTEDVLTLENPLKEYQAVLPVGAKVTLVHERRVGYSNGQEWRLSPISLEIYDAKTMHLIASDLSEIDTVHQVANCKRNVGERNCADSDKEINAIIRVKLQSSFIDGSADEPFALASSTPISESRTN